MKDVIQEYLCVGTAILKERYHLVVDVLDVAIGQALCGCHLLIAAFVGVSGAGQVIFYLTF
jgi:hypothetical protein